MKTAFICDAVRTPIGRYGGSLSSVRTDDLAAIPLRALLQRHSHADWEQLDEVALGCANQAGEDNRNVARMALLLAGIPQSVPGVTVNRLCASGMEAIGSAARAIAAGEIEFAIAGGVESMSRAPFVMSKADTAFSRSAEIYDTTIGWRFINPLMKEQYGVDSMPETAGNASGINDGAAAMILASEGAVKRHGLAPRARVLGMAAAGVPPRIMGIGPVPSTKKLLSRLQLSIGGFDFIELNEAFASQSLACLRQLGIADDAPHVNPNGGAISLGHPLGMSGARLVLTAVHQLQKTGAKRALATMCVGVGQGVSLAIERV